MKPVFVNYSDVAELKNKHPEIYIDDTISLAIDELYDINFPAKKDVKNNDDVLEFGQKLTGQNSDEWGSWVYYPWHNRLVHVPPQTEFRALRTSRNRNLITTEEQRTLYDASILVIGMSVGSNIAEALVAQGIGGRLILVDMDIIEPSNLNRIRSPYYHVGLHKVEAVSRKIWEIDPYMEIVDYLNGLTENNLQQIITDHKPKIIVDEMDDLRMKIVLREVAKSHRLPVVMAADDGDDALIDIERYDLLPDIELFNGQIPQPILDKIKSEKIPRPEIGMIIGRYFVGVDNTPLRMFQSLREVGKSLPSWPQLGGAAALSGVTLAYVIKKILLGHLVRDGRVLISLDEKLDLEHLNPVHQRELQHYKRIMKGQI